MSERVYKSRCESWRNRLLVGGLIGGLAVGAAVGLSHALNPGQPKQAYLTESYACPSGSDFAMTNIIVSDEKWEGDVFGDVTIDFTCKSASGNQTSPTNRWVGYHKGATVLRIPLHGRYIPQTQPSESSLYIRGAKPFMSPEEILIIQS